MDTVTTIAPERSRSVPSAAPKRSRKRTLGKVDWRTVAGKRIAELKRLFASELTSAGLPITAMRQLRIDAAAQAVALAEKARSRFLREGTGDVADLVAVQRNADAAVRRIGLPVDRPPAPVGVSAPTMPAPARPPTIAEVAAEQVRRAVKPAAVDAATPMSGPGPDLSELGDDELDRLKVYLREIGGAADV